MVGSHPYSLFSLSGNNVDIHEHKETVDWEERKKKIHIKREREKKKVRFISIKFISSTGIKSNLSKAIKIRELISPLFEEKNKK